MTTRSRIAIATTALGTGSTATIRKQDGGALASSPSGRGYFQLKIEFSDPAPGDFYVMFVNLFVRDFRFKMFVYFPRKVYINGKYAIFCILRNRKG